GLPPRPALYSATPRGGDRCPRDPPPAPRRPRGPRAPDPDADDLHAAAEQAGDPRRNEEQDA
ncbi:MAG: hypothetical protein ACTHU0_09935, partial [Kofleriaceae bacterium]